MKKIIYPTVAILLLTFSLATVSQANKVVVIPLPDNSSKDGQMLYNNNGLVGGAPLYYDKYSGFVGIGTESPGKTLDVNGTINADSFTINGDPICQAKEIGSPVFDDLIVAGSLAAGSGTTPGMTFGMTTLYLADENLRILFHDTSATASFPTNDWSISVNDLDNTAEPKSYFAIDDVDAGTRPFIIEAGAPDNALFIQNNTGNVGIGTAQPNSHLHVNGYIQLDLTVGIPPSSDCDQSTEYGRMIIDSSAGLLYLCSDSGWLSK